MIPEPSEPPITVAAIDDSEVVGKVVARLLSTDRDIRVVGVLKSASEARDFLTEHTVDAVTLDLNLPDDHGPEMIDRIIAAGRCGVVVISGNPAEHVQALSHGATAAFDKAGLVGNHASLIAAVRRAALQARDLRAAA